jgi:glycosyltransferase involved in cell wall biosynthesis
MNKKPLISVIMNCLNCEKYLNEAIDSVYAQTYENWEIIFWDNGSCDRSKDIAKSYDSKLRYFSSDETYILGKARALAVQEARGQYLAFLDCDDLWFKDKLKNQLKLFFEGEENLGLVYGRCEVFYQGLNQKVVNQNKLPEGMIFKSLLKENFIPFVSALVRSDVFYSSGGFPINIKHSTDYWLFLNISKKYRVRALQEVCCTYRYHSENLSSNNKILAAKEAIQIVSNFLPNKDAIYGLNHHYDNLTIAYIKNKLFFKAIINLFNHGGFLRIFFRLLTRLNIFSKGLNV